MAANSRQRNAQGQTEEPPWPCAQWVQTGAVVLAGVLAESTPGLDLKQHWENGGVGRDDHSRPFMELDIAFKIACWSFRISLPPPAL